MIVFSLGEGPGQLFKALAVFALRDLDLLKVWRGADEEGHGMKPQRSDGYSHAGTVQ
jgi:hypothetical protein